MFTADGVHAPEHIHAITNGGNVTEKVNSRLLAGHWKKARSGSGLGEDSDGSHVKIVGGMGNGFANGLGDRKSVVLAAAARRREVSHIAFGFEDDFGHHGHRLAWILSAGSFGGEHDRIAAVEDGGGHIAGLGPRGTVVLDRRF